jgi:hypothetical protein
MISAGNPQPHIPREVNPGARLKITYYFIMELTVPKTLIPELSLLFFSFSLGSEKFSVRKKLKYPLYLTLAGKLFVGILSSVACY